jgi:transposase-like protein
VAGADRMTIEEVVRSVLLEEHADVLRAAVEAVCAELMEVEVSQLIGAERGERRPRDRATHRNGYRAREWQTRAGTVDLQIPKLRRGSYFSSAGRSSASMSARPRPRRCGPTSCAAWIKRGLVGVQLAISDAHAGLKAAIAKILGCAWQRCTVHFVRDCLGRVREHRHGLLAALIRPIFDAASIVQARDRLSRRLRISTAGSARSPRCSRTPGPTSAAFYAFPESNSAELEPAQHRRIRPGRTGSLRLGAGRSQVQSCLPDRHEA